MTISTKSYEQHQSIGPQITKTILNGCAMSPDGVTEVVFYHQRGTGNWSNWRWGIKPSGSGYAFEAQSTGADPNGVPGSAPPEDWSETYCA